MATITFSGNEKIKRFSSIAPESNMTPGLAAQNGTLYMAYRQAGSNTLFDASYDGQNWQGNTPLNMPPGAIAPESNYGPSMAVLKGTLFMFYKGAHSNVLYSAYYDGVNWRGNVPIKNQLGGIAPESNMAPCAVTYGDLIYLIYKGANSDELYVATFNGLSWKSNQRIAEMPGGITPESNFPPTATVWRNRLYLFYKGAHSNDLYQAFFNSKYWTGNQRIRDISDINPQSDQSPAAGILGEQILMVYKGGNSSNLYYSVLDINGWSGNKKISTENGTPKSSKSPGLALLGDTLYIVYKGESKPNLFQMTTQG